MEDKADPEVQSDVDTLILDYLLCNAINAILRSRIAERRGQVHSWDVTGFMSLFSSGFIIHSVPPQVPATEDSADT